MTAVTVDLEDLETIVFATGVIKSIEQALTAHKSDPFVQPHLSFTVAHDRLATAMRDARRADAGMLVNFDEPLTDDELKALRKVNPHFVIPRKDKAPQSTEAMVVWDRLAAKGCVKIGQLVTGIVFPGGQRVEEVLTNPNGFAIRLTERGHRRLVDAAKP